MKSRRAPCINQAQCQEAQLLLSAAQQPPDTASAGALDTAVEHFRSQSAQGEKISAINLTPWYAALAQQLDQTAACDGSQAEPR